jgi:flagellin
MPEPRPFRGKDAAQSRFSTEETMSLRINHNIASLNGHRNMVKNDAAVSRSLEKLSSGLKINRAADNAAGLVISEQMRAQLNGIKQAMNNTEQAVTMVQTAEGALDEMNNLLSKVKSLALHALNSGVSDTAQRVADDSELQNILSSVDRIANQTRFAGQTLLSGGFATNGALFQVGEQGGDRWRQRLHRHQRHERVRHRLERR